MNDIEMGQLGQDIFEAQNWMIPDYTGQNIDEILVEYWLTPHSILIVGVKQENRRVRKGEIDRKRKRNR